MGNLEQHEVSSFCQRFFLFHLLLFCYDSRADVGGQLPAFCIPRNALCSLSRKKKKECTVFWYAVVDKCCNLVAKCCISSCLNGVTSGVAEESKMN